MSGLGYLHGIESLLNIKGGRPVQTLPSSIVARVGTAPDADNNKFPLNEPIAMIGDGSLLEDLGTTGTLPDAYSQQFKEHGSTTSVMIRVEEGADFDATLANIIGTAGAQTGIHALRAAQSETGLVPRIFDVPGFTSQRVANSRNPVVAELMGFATRNRGWIIADGPNTTKEDAVQYAQDWGSPRVFVVDPGVKIRLNGLDVVRPASPSVTGLMCRVDQEKGFHHSISNHELFGITGTARPIEFLMGERNCEANYLNEHRVATIIRDGGYKLWGNESTSSEPLTKFLAVQRTQDLVMDSVAAAHKWAIDKPFSVQAILDIAETVNGYLRQLKARGVTLGGKVWIDPTLNTKESWVNGDLFVSYDAEPPAPMQHIIFQFNRNTGYYAELADDAVAEVARLSNQ
ncbi:phage tail sheath C-terminal domain-containing protein [Halocynthiibacter styelae]|uniref:Phage tail sheath subtilisin-like domain-containing protein n=1 Tax=Halocynthiibacter styelae TaxID=2761955 RepID=A0A8J7LLI0_9RHOB|nr:phage tail sheath C-terminal domain-containing protein [Paenihalocynthiibacter styelae]MBI1495410.1 phage tail sheath subtilisin-like domain-containing protein [Paenihalocynthiibacter styelae]